MELLGGRGIECEPPPGRVFIVGPRHTFEQFAHAIDSAFARWDLSHLHEFELRDGRKTGDPDDDLAPDLVWLDHAKLKGVRELESGEEHRCVVEPEKADPAEAYGFLAAAPLVVWGWAGFRVSTAGARLTAKAAAE